MNKINYDKQTLSLNELSLVTGGHLEIPGAATLAVLISLPHAIVGIIEFYNKVGERIEHGCSHIEDGDYFSRHLCGATHKIRDYVNGKPTATEL